MSEGAAAAIAASMRPLEESLPGALGGQPARSVGGEVELGLKRASGTNKENNEGGEGATALRAR